MCVRERERERERERGREREREIKREKSSACVRNEEKKIVLAFQIKQKFWIA